MVRLKLQLFAKAVTDAIVNDVIRGKYGNGEARKTALKNAGYDYASVQSAVNAKLKGTSSGTPKANTPKTNNSNNASNGGTQSSLLGVDKSLSDKAEQPFAPSENLGNLKNEEDDTYGALKEHVNTPIVDQSIKDILSTPFSTSEAFNQAWGLLQSDALALRGGTTSWTDDIERMFTEIENREKFEYDVDNDQLFQQALASAMNSGKTAMQDTIGQASALTGGYGSTYATSAGNQAYNAFIEDAYDNLPQYYNMALQAYQAEGEEMFNLLSAYMSADSAEWQKNVDSFNANASVVQQMWNQETFAYEAGQTQAMNLANVQMGEWGAMTDALTGLHTAASDRYTQEYQREWNAWNAEVQNTLTLMGIYNTDAWNQKNYEQTEEWNQKTYDQTEKWNQKDLDYKNASLAENKRQFNISRGDLNNDGELSPEEEAKLSGGVKDGYVVKVDEKGNKVQLKEPTQKQKEDALKAYNEGGTAGLKKYLASIPESYDLESISNYAYDYGEAWVADYDDLIDGWVITNDTENGREGWGGWFLSGLVGSKGDDHDDEYTKNGKTLTYDQLKDRIANSNMPEEYKQKVYSYLKNQSKN